MLVPEAIDVVSRHQDVLLYLPYTFPKLRLDRELRANLALALHNTIWGRECGLCAHRGKTFVKISETPDEFPIRYICFICHTIENPTTTAAVKASIASDVGPYGTR